MEFFLYSCGKTCFLTYNNQIKSIPVFDLRSHCFTAHQDSQDQHLYCSSYQECIRMGDLNKSMQLQQKPVVKEKLLNHTKNRTLVTCTLSNMIYLFTVCAVCVTIFSIGGKFCPVLNFMQLHALTQVACSYTLLFVLHNKNYIFRRNFCKFSHFN